MTDRLPAIILALVLALGLSVPLWAGTADAPPSWENYQVIVARNIFLRSRAEEPKQAQAPQPLVELPPFEPPAPPPLEASFVLTGVSTREGRSIAFIEHIDRGTTMRLGAGDRVAGGRVAEIALDGIIYEQEGRRLQVRIGHALDGSVYSPPVEPRQTVASSLPPLTVGAEPARQGPSRRAGRARGGIPERDAAPAAPRAEVDEQAVLERLRQRRQEEENQ